jgi:hypothetical protein
VKRVRNASEFEREIFAIRRFYDEEVKPAIIRNRGEYTNIPANNVPKGAKDQVVAQGEVLLEAHMRRYYIDAFLKALNWQFESDSLKNLIQEFPIQSPLKDEIRFLDYFGMNENKDKALLILETKKPSSKLPLPVGNRSGSPPKGKSFESIIISSLSGDSELTNEWQEWLNTLRDYSQSVNTKSGHFPKRVVITNGEWLIVFSNPEDTFCSGCPSLGNVHVYENWTEVEEQNNKIFKLLEYYEVLGEAPPLSLGEVGFYLRSTELDRAMFGLRLMYLEEPEFYLDPSPIIKVVPVIFIRSINGVWFRVEAQNSTHILTIPNKSDFLKEHLESFHQKALELLDKVNTKLGVILKCKSLAAHYADQDFFDKLTPVVKVTNKSDKYEEYLIATGDKTHYLLKEATVPNCPYHSWDNSYSEGYAVGAHPVKRSQINDPRTIFVTDSQHHCSHRHIREAKGSKITIENRDRCGPRSGKDQEAFCEIWKFEQHLCCRTCVFEAVCTKADVFQELPCKNGSSSAY